MNKYLRHTGQKVRNTDENLDERNEKYVYSTGMTFPMRKIKGCVMIKKLLAEYSLEIILFYN